MKKLITLFIILLQMACKDKDVNYTEILNQNNEYLKNKLELEMLILEEKSQVKVLNYEEKFKTVCKLKKEIYSVDNFTDYQSTKNNILDFCKKEKIDFEFKLVKSNNKELLQNNLLLNFLKFCDIIKIFRPPVGGMGCRLGKWVEAKSYRQNDSINLEFEARYNVFYEIVIDSIIDNNSKISNYKQDQIKKICNVRFKSNSKNSTIYWKAYLTDEFAGRILAAKEIQKVTK